MSRCESAFGLEHVCPCTYSDNRTYPPTLNPSIPSSCMKTSDRLLPQNLITDHEHHQHHHPTTQPTSQAHPPLDPPNPPHPPRLQRPHHRTTHPSSPRHPPPTPPLHLHPIRHPPPHTRHPPPLNPNLRAHASVPNPTSSPPSHHLPHKQLPHPQSANPKTLPHTTPLQSSHQTPCVPSPPPHPRSVAVRARLRGVPRRGAGGVLRAEGFVG